MKFVLACYGSRGDVEPSVAVGRELLGRGHEVRMAVPADLVGLAESAGLTAVPYGPDLQTLLEPHHKFWKRFFGNFWRIRELAKAWREVWEPRRKCWAEMSTTLTPLAEGSDLLVSGLVFEEPAANVAEYHGIPLASLHYFPIRVNGRFVPSLPPPLTRIAMTVHEWLNWRVIKSAEDAQRRELGLPKATAPSPRRITERGSLEIQAYDEICFPGLAAEWAKYGGQRPFVGALTMELPTDADEEAASWIAAGAPPVFFGFGSLLGGISRRDAGDDQRGQRAVGRAGAGVRRLERLQRHPTFGARQGGGRGELRGDLSGLPRGRAPRWRRVQRP